MSICENCGRRIFEGDTYYEINGKPICIDCVFDYLDEYCKEVDEEDEESEFYVVDDTSYELDEVDQILRSCARITELDDMEEADMRDEPEYWRE